MFDFNQRIADLRKKCSSNSLDGFLTTHSPNLRWLCGFSGSNGLIIISQSRVLFFTDFRYKIQSEDEVTADETIICKGNLLDGVRSYIHKLKLKRIGIEKDHLSIGFFNVMKKKMPTVSYVEISEIVEKLRSVKSDAEIRLISSAVAISDKVFQKIIGMIKPGISENDISAEISYLHKKYGAEKDAFDTIVVSGERGAFPHGRASNKKIERGDFITLDFGCVYQGYHSDMTRTVAVAKASTEMKKVYSVVLKAQQKSCDLVSVKMKTKKLDGVARSVISKSGYGKYFGHSLGHGIGLEIHELPRISPRSKESLIAGQVLTIEPGIYIPNKFGIRIEDTVVVRADGPEILTTSPKDLLIL